MGIKLWIDKSTKKVDPELFSEKANALAAEIFKGMLASRDKANKPTQLRKFYDEVLRFDSTLKELPREVQKEKFQAYLPYLKMLNAKAAYAMARDLVSKDFKDFISDSLKQIDDVDDFRVFVHFFEAFMGFYKFHHEKGDRPQSDRGGRR